MLEQTFVPRSLLPWTSETQNHVRSTGGHVLSGCARLIFPPRLATLALAYEVLPAARPVLHECCGTLLETPR